MQLCSYDTQLVVLMYQPCSHKQAYYCSLCLKILAMVYLPLDLSTQLSKRHSYFGFLKKNFFSYTNKKCFDLKKIFLIRTSV